MASFTNIDPTNATGLLSTKTPALIAIYNTIHNHVVAAQRINPAPSAVVFTTKNTKLQIVTAIDALLADSNITYEEVEFSLQEPTRAQEGKTAIDDTPTEQNLALPQGDEGGPIYPVPTPAEQAIAVATVKRLRKNGVSDETIRSTVLGVLSAPDTTEDDGTTGHGVSAAALAILDTPTTRRATTTPGTRTTLLPTQIITSVVATNPKKPHGASAKRFNEYYTLTAPFTVQDVLQSTSITRGDILWDVRHGFITFG